MLHALFDRTEPVNEMVVLALCMYGGVELEISLQLIFHSNERKLTLSGRWKTERKQCRIMYMPPNSRERA